MFFIFFLLFVLNVCFASSFKKRVILVYRIYWGFIPVGESKIKISPGTYESEVYTIGIGRWFFPFLAKWVTFVDSNGYPVKVIITSQKRNEVKTKEEFFYPEEGKVVVKRKHGKTSSISSYSIKFPVYDELSAFVKSFTLNYKNHSKVELPVFIKGERCFIKISVEGFVKFRGKSCVKLLVELPKKSELLKHSSKVEVLLSLHKKVPVILRSKLPIFGHLTGKLKKVVYFNSTSSP